MKLKNPTGISAEEAYRLAQTPGEISLESLCYKASELRTRMFGTKIGLCSIVNAKQGGCPENCAFCAQSQASTEHALPAHPMLSSSTLATAATKAASAGAHAFSLVTSGRKIVRASEFKILADALARIQKTKLLRCASLGLLEKHELAQLRDAGLERYHCNLEAAPSFFPRVCTSHSLADKVRTIKAAQRVGLEVCSGGIFGMGETLEQRIELALMLRDLGIASVPINFLDPRPNTPLADTIPLSLEECLRSIAIFRLVLPLAEIIIMGGQKNQLRDPQGLMFRAGASGTLLGDALTTKGASVRETKKRLQRQGLTLGQP
jgi:biotin synthase